MKWALVTTVGRNPGDDFIRVGVKKLIEAVDDNPSYVLIDKEKPKQWKNPVKFDKAVWCGMPLFWSIPPSSSYNILWSPLINGWISERKNDFMIMGAGSFCTWGKDKKVYRGKKLKEWSKKVYDRSYLITVRDPVANEITGLDMPVMTCPAVFATMGLTDKKRNLVNLMPAGGHYKIFHRKEADIWSNKLATVAEVLKDWTFISHNPRETAFADRYGFRDVIEFKNAERGVIDLLRVYSGCNRYFGNRVHGGIVSRGVNADVRSVGYDSRQEAVKLAGGNCYLPSEVNIDELKEWGEGDKVENDYDLDGEFKKQVKLMKEFTDS